MFFYDNRCQVFYLINSTRLQGTYDPSFSIALQCKDNRLGYQIATKHRVSIAVSMSEMFALSIYIIPLHCRSQLAMKHRVSIAVYMSEMFALSISKSTKLVISNSAAMQIPAFHEAQVKIGLYICSVHI